MIEQPGFERKTGQCGNFTGGVTPVMSHAILNRGATDHRGCVTAVVCLLTYAARTLHCTQCIVMVDKLCDKLLIYHTVINDIV